MGVGGWGFGPNPQSPIPNPQSPIPTKNINYFLINFILLLNKYLFIKILFYLK